MTSAVRFNHNSPENNLDALLEDLQTTISGTKQNGISNGHGPGVKASGYRETIRSHATERDGKLVESNREYDIQYLKPANSTTVLTESSSPTFLDKHDLSSGTKGGNTYKSVSYTYNTSNTGSTNTSRDVTKSTDTKLKQNINELDSLLEDITHKTGFASSGTALTPSPKSQYTELREKIESSNSPRVGGHVSRIEQRTFEEQHEKRYGTVLPPRTDSETRRELKFVGNSSRDGSLTRPIRDQSPSPVRHKEVYFQESRTTSRGGDRSPSPIRNSNLIAANNGKVASTVKSYDYRSQSSRTAEEIGRSLRERTPSPTAGTKKIIRYDYEKTTTRSVTPPKVVHHYDYQSTTTSSGSDKTYALPATPSPPAKMQQYEYQKTTTSDNYRPVSPPPTTVQQYEYQKTTTSNNYRPITPPPTTVQQYEYQKTTTSNSYRPITPPPTTVQQYEYQKTTTNVREKPRTPPPHRSPSPVSFAQPPDPHVNQTIASYSTFEKGVNRSSPLPVRSPEPTVITYKYSSTSTERKQYPPTVTHHYELDESRTKVETTTEKPRPFPVTEADKLAHPGHQEPPKQVEELMASFSHSEYQQSIDLPDAPKPRPPTPPPPAPVGPAVNPAPQANGTVGKSKNLAGPPVYYPPGELFTAKVEASMQQSAGGKMKGKMMSKYKYKEGGWRKEKSGTTTIPVCLPLCCAAPCVIM
nr:PREDICTED: proteoglycan 4 isoform X1 [Bemisia tabaci]XP_018896221.1 PREDICTED: proteoglycan 4 isoform X1 [Bemisia tabaci]